MADFQVSTEERKDLLVIRYRIQFAALCLTGQLFAQTSPCGRDIVAVGGSSTEERFLEAAPNHVKASLVRALPVVAAKLEKDQGMKMRAKTDIKLLKSWNRRNKEAGIDGFSRHGIGGMGKFEIELKPTVKDGKEGTQVRIDFHKNKLVGRSGSSEQATPLMEETTCLVGILSDFDPVANPRGPAGAITVSGDFELPEGTPIKLLLRDYIYSKNIKKRKDEAIAFEVAEDIEVADVTVVRKGALAVGRFTAETEGAGGYRKAGELEFLIEGVNAVDGQALEVAGASEGARGAGKENTIAKTLRITFTDGGWAFGWASKGVEALVRAGTAFDVQTVKGYTIHVGE